MSQNQNESKYKAQIKYLRNNYKRITIDFKNEDLQKFKAICKKNNTTPTAEIKKFVNNYIKSME